MAFGSRTVAQRDVDFNVNLGQFRAQLGEADALYTRTTGSMSTAALRLSVKQAELAKAIKTQGAESLSAARKTIALREETERLGVASTSTRDRVLSEERALGRLTRGAVAGSGAFSGLGRSLAFSSAAFLGGAGLVYALRASVKAAEAMQVSQGQLQVSLKDSNLAWDANKAHILAALDAQVKSTAFTKDDLTTNLALFVRRYGDVNKALAANALAADVARGKNEDLATATKQVLGASLGNTRAARQLAIVPVQKVTEAVDALRATTKHATADQLANAKAADVQATATKTLAAIDAAYHGSAAKYLTTSAGKQALFNAELRTTEEIIGQALLPTLNKYLAELTVYLTKLNESGRLQKDVKEVTHGLAIAFHDGAAAVHAIAGAFDILKPLLGGTKNEIEAITAALILFKLRGVNAFKTGAAEIEAASGPLIAAERRSAAGANVPRGAGGAGAGGGKSGPSAVDIIVASTLAPYAFHKGEQFSRFVFGSGKKSNQAVAFTNPDDPRNSADLFANPNLRFASGPNGSVSAYLGNEVVATWAANDNSIMAQAARSRTTVGNQRAVAQAAQNRLLKAGTTKRGGSGDKGGKGGGDKPGLVLGLTNAQLTALLVAQGTPGTADDEKALKDQLAIYNRLLGQKGLNAAQRNDLLSGRNSVTSQLQSIQQADAATTAAAKAKAAAAAARAAAAEKKKRAALVSGLEQAPVGLRTAVEAALANNASEDKLLVLYRKERAAIEAQIVELKKIGAGKDAILKARTNEAAIQKHINAILKTKTKSTTGAVQAQKFEDELSGILGQFASNVSGRPGGLPTGSRPLTIVQNFAKPVSHFAAQRAAREAANHYPI